AFPLRVFLDPDQDLQPAHARHVQVEEDQVGPGSSGMSALPAQEGEGLLAVLDPVDAVAHPPLAKGVDGQLGLVDGVFDEEDLDGSCANSHRAHGSVPPSALSSRAEIGARNVPATSRTLIEAKPEPLDLLDHERELFLVRWLANAAVGVQV